MADPSWSQVTIERFLPPSAFDSEPDWPIGISLTTSFLHQLINKEALRFAFPPRMPQFHQDGQPEALPRSPSVSPPSQEVNDPKDSLQGKKHRNPATSLDRFHIQDKVTAFE